VQGYAPDGWSRVVSHLRRSGFDDEVIVAPGLASATSNGYLVDRFRDRIMFVAHDIGLRPVGFVGSYWRHSVAVYEPVAGPPLRDRVRRSQTGAISACDGTRPQPRHLMIPAVLLELKRVDWQIVVADEEGGGSGGLRAWRGPQSARRSSGSGIMSRSSSRAVI
jgi:hypothetical protein